MFSTSLLRLNALKKLKSRLVILFVIKIMLSSSLFSLCQCPEGCPLESRGTARSSSGSSSPTSLLYGKTSRTGDLDLIYCSFSPHHTNISEALMSSTVLSPSVVVWPQCTEGSDALPGEPREGLPAERAGGSVVQGGPAGRPADGVRGHGSEAHRGR